MEMQPVNIVVPEMGESIVDARVAKWFKREGDAVTVGEALVELETDKVDIEVAAPVSGVLGPIAHPAGSDVKIGDVLGTVAGARGTVDGERSTVNGERLTVGGQRTAETEPRPTTPTTPATPSARQAARDNKVDIATVPTTGPRVTKDDVLKAASVDRSPLTVDRAPSTEGSETRQRMTRRRATIAKRLVEVQATAAMLTTFNEVDMSAVMAMRARHKESFAKKHGVNLGLSSFFVKATVAALKAFPRLNAEIQGDEIVLKHYYDIGMAVGSEEGLVVPVIRQADQLSFAEIEQSVRAFAGKAKDGTLSLNDLRGGSFTITNGGVFGSMMSTPILNPPQVGILGLHAIKERPVGVDGQIVLRPMMYIALTYDHRIVDGSEAVRFLVKIKELIEEPAAMLIEG